MHLRHPKYVFAAGCHNSASHGSYAQLTQEIEACTERTFCHSQGLIHNFTQRRIVFSTVHKYKAVVYESAIKNITNARSLNKRNNRRCCNDNDFTCERMQGSKSLVCKVHTDLHAQLGWAIEQRHAQRECGIPW
jgi:hypothetical protein